MSLDTVYRLTSIGRPLYPQVPSNRAVLILLPALLLALTLVVWWLGWPGRVAGGFADALLFGMKVALAAFLAWALARELLPDDNAAAFLAMAAVVALWLLLPMDHLLLLICALMLSRIANRSTGLAPRVWDYALVAALALYTEYQFYAALDAATSPAIAWITALGFALDGWFQRRDPDPDTRLAGHWWGPVFAIVLVAASLLLAGWQEIPLWPTALSAAPLASMPPWHWLVPGLVIVAYGWMMWRQTQPRSHGDCDQRRLRLDRVRAAQLLVALLAILPAVTGVRGMMATTGLWMVMAALAVSWFSGLGQRFPAAAPAAD